MSSSDYGIFRDDESYALPEICRRVQISPTDQGKRTVRESLQKMGVSPSKGLGGKPFYSGKLINLAIRHDCDGGNDDPL